MARLTDAKLRSLRPKAERYEIFEGDGFGARISPTGRVSFVWLYHYQGRPRRLTLGRYAGGVSNPGDEVLSLADARLAVAAARKVLDAGRDPGTETTTKRRDDRNAETFEDLAESYLERWAKPRKRSASEDERILNYDVIPAWKGRKAKEIAKADVARLLDKIVRRGSPIMANRTLACIRKVFNFAIGADLAGVQHNPCHLIARPSAENRRDRELTDAEIKTFWWGIDKGVMAEDIRRALRLQLVTAQRKGEIVQIEPAKEIDLTEMVWTIPPEKAKNGRAHAVPLSPLAGQIIKAQMATLPKNARYLFPARFKQDHLTALAVNHAVRNNRKKIGVDDVTPHDLRRTAATKMASLGVDRFVLGRVLNHSDASVTGIYDRFDYLPEKRKALETWAKRLGEVIAPAVGKNPKVVQMRARK